MILCTVLQNTENKLAFKCLQCAHIGYILGLDIVKCLGFGPQTGKASEKFSTNPRMGKKENRTFQSVQ